ncbi:hypothetical protein AgCh_037527 [Apium graveolens]
MATGQFGLFVPLFSLGNSRDFTCSGVVVSYHARVQGISHLSSKFDAQDGMGLSGSFIKACIVPWSVGPDRTWHW